MGNSYNEFSIANITCTRAQYFYDGYPSEPWPVVVYEVTLSRVESFYNWALIMPAILMVLISFTGFFMSHEVGERLSFGITLILTLEVARVVTSAWIPICGELLWVELFNVVQTIFSTLALLESCVVLFLAYHEDEHILPSWLVKLLALATTELLLSLDRLCCGGGGARRRNHQNGQEMGGSNLLRNDAAAAGGVAAASGRSGKERVNSLIGRIARELEAVPVESESVAARIFKDLGLRYAENAVSQTVSGELPRSPSGGSDGRARGATFSRKEAPAGALPGTAGRLEADAALSSKDVEKLVFFEKMFFELDTSASGFISLQTAATFLGFAKIDLSLEERNAAIGRANTSKEDSKLIRLEFVELCLDTLWSVPLAQLVKPRMRPHIRHRIRPSSAPCRCRSRSSRSRRRTSSTRSKCSRSATSRGGARRAAPSTSTRGGSSRPSTSSR